MSDNIRIFWHDELDSTNSEALRCMASIDNLSVIAARCQSAGRGQRGNRWLSAPGENLTFSLVLRFDAGRFPSREQMRLTAYATVAVRQYLLDRAIPARIKWPNDIYVGDRKICGMLIENGLSGAYLDYSIIGIGLNVNQIDFSPELMNPTSMRKVSGREYAPETELEELCGYFLRYYPLLQREQLWNAYSEHLYRQGEIHDYSDGQTGEILRGTIKGVRHDGRLVFTLTDGSSRYFAFKEIGYIL